MSETTSLSNTNPLSLPKDSICNTVPVSDDCDRINQHSICSWTLSVRMGMMRGLGHNVQIRRHGFLETLTRRLEVRDIAHFRMSDMFDLHEVAETTASLWRIFEQHWLCCMWPAMEIDIYMSIAHRFFGLQRGDQHVLRHKFRTDYLAILSCSNWIFVSGRAGAIRAVVRVGIVSESYV